MTDQKSFAITIYIYILSNTSNIEPLKKIQKHKCPNPLGIKKTKKLSPDSPVSLKHKTEAMWEDEQLPRFSLVLLGHSRREASSPVQLNPLSQYGPRRLLMVASSSW